MSSAITRRPVTSSDEAFLFRVFASTRSDEMALVDWDEAQKLAFLESQFRAQATDYARRFPDSEHSILLAGGEPVGQVWIGRWADEIRLLDIAVLPDWRNRGIGAFVVRQLQDDAVAAGLPLCHSVFTGNIGARRFYERLGFEVVKDFDMYVLMEWTDR